MRTKASKLAFSVLCSTLLAANTWGAYSAGEPGRNSGSKNPLNNVYFGEDHLHTAASPDAFVVEKPARKDNVAMASKRSR